MKSAFGAVAASFVLSSTAWAAEPWTGAWPTFVKFANGASAATLVLSEENGAISGTSGPLDENGYWPLVVKGRSTVAGATLNFLRRDKPVGTVVLTRNAGGFMGTGALYGVAVRMTGTSAAAPKPAVRREFTPQTYSTRFDGQIPPVLHLSPGDAVKTSTLDNEGRDRTLAWRGMPGNTLTGPFYVDGAMPGDTLVVRLDSVTLNRDVAHMASSRLNGKAVQAGHVQTPVPGWNRDWTLDRDKGAARPASASGRLAGLALPLAPMVGSIGVAPPSNQGLAAGDLGFHGGNLDYRRLTAGVTLYFPVYQAGALLSLGDGHALQGDGEITGQGLETSLDVTFTVDLIKGRNLGQVWSEDSEFVMVSGIDNSLDDSLKMATSGLARWLAERYGLNDSEIAALLGATVEYDIAEVVDPRPHVVAKISKKTLAMLGEPRP
ncbi:acetamidase/formamidase family protein [Caulobacter soli]|uniref:acetamidase/formamidase family protein n=1 Tax=Caulobacter soli TaxID=2708539 RepID=UPI0013EDCE9E|nr:acetamidase/formamidase family protein [Caulobacter soli]